MEEPSYESLENSLVSIASEVFRFGHVFNRAISKLEFDEIKKYSSQFAWLGKQVVKALDAAGLQIVDLTGQQYDAGMAVTPLNIEEFEADEALRIQQMLEPIVMKDGTAIKTGTVILGRMISE